jgi:hypothetical protein
VGRRSRRRASSDAHERKSPATRDRQARVKVADDVWDDFRLLTRTEGIGEALGRLVTREVERWRIARIRDGSADDQAVLDALERAHELQVDLTAIVARLERRQKPSHYWSPDDEW